ncbi:uncharacterized protein LOC107813069 isoform X1 [Nicotiana tabacum]|uniref:Uncharacterized protein isoform X1 n=1 Tax=Nicotiana tabacum TaxID=4097 RepID=A0A1S4BXY4_TOBAC|nr:uncharacterized protein LOC104109789 isoform X2 [Nicotiana tomentosiformis]XP_016493762.1 PREDICTED: uncharacterized protein LOC107813069 isoform X1 [Nicotiana tabacum]XP_016493763.1 PREDICTED: uncharacterized protein LOC107813069 isoform X1 [Nicotiana tabacum]
MDSKEPNKCSYAEKRKAAMQLKRLDTQSQISAHSREAMLLSRRMRRQHSTKHSLLQSPFFAVPQQSTSSWDKAGFLKQTALTIREPPSLPEKVVGHQACTPTSWDNLEKGKGILDPPIICETVTVTQFETLLQLKHTLRIPEKGVPMMGQNCFFVLPYLSLLKSCGVSLWQKEKSASHYGRRKSRQRFNWRSFGQGVPLFGFCQLYFSKFFGA